MESEIRSVAVDGHSIAYRRAGDGDALVLLHGFLSDSRCWQPQLAGLSDRFSVIAWDAPGAGASSDPTEPFTTADWTHVLAGFLDAIDVGRSHVVGLSWGGILAQEYFRLYSARIHSLVFADTYAGWKGSLPDDGWRDRLTMCLEHVDLPAAVVAERFVRGMFTEDVDRTVRDTLFTIISEFHPVGFRLMSLSSAEQDTNDLLRTIDIPTLVLWGENDQRSTIEVAERFAATIPGAELAIISDAGHVSNMEQPEPFNDHVRRFCSRRS